MTLSGIRLADGYCEPIEPIQAVLPVAIFLGRGGERGLNFELSAVKSVQLRGHDALFW